MADDRVTIAARAVLREHQRGNLTGHASSGTRALEALEHAVHTIDGYDAGAIHFMTGSATVQCGAKMRNARGVGWDLGTCTTDLSKVTCPGCLGTWAR